MAEVQSASEGAAEVEPKAQPAAVAAASVAVRIEYDAYVNYALQQNAVPLIRSVAVENRGSQVLEGVLLRIRAEPDLSAPAEIRIERIAPGLVHSLSAVDLHLSPSRLANQTEREAGELVVEVLQGGSLLHQSKLPLHVLSYSEWAGSQSIPEILAAFVLPNHPDVQRLLGAAREHLARATGSPALDGYQTHDPRRARAMLGAIYQAAADLGLTYVSPPASFERSGQKIRTPDQLVATGMGTCLDLALLLAAAAEQAGLHPLVVMLDGHAFAGAWLGEESFVDAAVDEASRLAKRVSLNWIEVVEATGLAARPPMGFEQAVAVAHRHLQDPKKFAYCIDVAAARKHGIRPLPLRTADGSVQPVVTVVEARDGPPAMGANPGTKTVPSGRGGGEVKEPPGPAPARVERWKRKLLDLSLRNRLLNFVPTKSTIPLLCPDVGRLEDVLAEGSAFHVLPRPKEAEGADPRDATLYEAKTGQRLVEDLLRSDLKQGRLRANLDATDLDRRLVEIDRAARTSLQEGGANTLYLAVGFVRWYESPSSKAERRAPILLIPLEISRRSVLEPYRISSADEDARINVTLLQKLKVDYGIEAEGFDELATDESGLDVAGILRRMREVVLPLDRWDVVEEAAIGLFSFTKYLMWMDLDKRTADLSRNAVVRHLIETPNEPFGGDAGLPRPEEIDAGRSPTDTYCPKDADSSQLCAVHAASDGRTFVLWGPPGTGKSQTITNIVANALGHGKRVLFVSEKAAALNVVKSRLEEVGLGAFCLELHSNKAQKAKVLAQLQQALDFREPKAPEEWERQGLRLREQTQQLNEHAEVLHRPRALGQSVFQGLGRLVALHDAPEVRLDLGAAEGTTAARYDGLREHAESMAAALTEVGPPGASSWRASRLEAWHPGLSEEVRTVVTELGEASRILRKALRALEVPLSIRAPDLSSPQVAAVGELCDLLAGAGGTPRALIESADFETLRPRIAGCIQSGREHATLLEDLRKRWRDSVLGLDLADLRARCAKAQASAWPLSWLRGRSSKRLLLPHATGMLQRLPGLLHDLEVAGRVQTLRRDLETTSSDVAAQVGSMWRGVESDFGALEAAVACAAGLRGLSGRLACGDRERLHALRQAWAALVTEGRDLLASGSPLRAQLLAVAEAARRFVAARARVGAVLALDERIAFGDEETAGHFDRVEQQTIRWLDRLRDLRAWCTWRRRRSQAADLKLGPLVERIEEGTLQPSSFLRTFERSFYAWWVAGIVASEPTLSQFDGRQHEDLIRRFRNLDILVTEGSHAVVQARVAGGLPRGRHPISSSSSSEMGILLRELEKKKRHLPIRRLFERVPNLICKFKPCMLMSPLSVAQFLTTDFPRFDMVVFDEASQIPVWDAIGAIARGEALICVGDPKQLPPTSFFMRSDEEEAEAEDVDVEEPDSILDECLGAQLPSLRLGWHYRSRHEGLIAFSNYHYYDNHMLTFPAALESSPDLGVSFVHVQDGIYDRGKSRANEVEARRVVEDVVRRLRDPERSRYSIGVVTFSIAQQTLIEDLLDAARREHPEIEPHFTDSVQEPVFVKNLENVQGDERDVILFSICYGPDTNGLLALNFGPMNRSGGERRLNVAVTRAKRQVVVFSSIKPEAIDLGRTSAIGMRHLKHFLEYAEGGSKVLGRELSVDASAEWESGFEEQVHRALAEKGLSVVPQVGCSGYRVDLGIKDPDVPGRFILGIECDGAMYHSGKTARDRDRLRQGVLESLGWPLHRIWSTDWWLDPEREIERVIQRVASLRRPSGRPPDAAGAHSAVPMASSLFASSAHMGQAAASVIDAASSADSAPAVAATYRAAPPLRARGGQDAFYAEVHSAAVRELALRVIAVEGPIEFKLLGRRVVEAYGLQRATERALDHLQRVLSDAPVRWTYAGGTTFLWGAHQDPHSYDIVRQQGMDERDQRSAEEIPPEEVAGAAAHVLREHVSLPVEDLAREAGRILGFKRTGANVKARVDLGLAILVERGRARREGGSLVWAG